MKCRQVDKCNNGYFAIYYIELPLSIIIVTIYLVIYGLFFVVLIIIIPVEVLKPRRQICCLHVA